MSSEGQAAVPRFRVLKGEALFQDGEDSVRLHYLQRQVNAEWVDVLQLTMESGRSWGDEIDRLYRRISPPDEYLVHVSGFGYWGDAEYYRSVDAGLTWQPTHLRREPDPALFHSEILPQV